MTVDTPENREFLTRWRAHSGRDAAVMNDAMEASVLAFRLWAGAVEQAGTVEAGAVRGALPDLVARSLSGFDVFVDPTNNHLHKPAMIGRIGGTGAIDIVWRSEGLIAPEVDSVRTAHAIAAE
jgi:urea transport system substrate-binding protein